MKKYKNTEFLAEEWRKRLKTIKGLGAYSDREAGYADGEAMAYAAVLDDLEHVPEVDEETIYRRVKRRYLKEDIEAVLADDFDIEEPSYDMLCELADMAENAMEWNLAPRNVIHDTIQYYLDTHGL